MVHSLLLRPQGWAITVSRTTLDLKIQRRATQISLMELFFVKSNLWSRKQEVIWKHIGPLYFLRTFYLVLGVQKWPGVFFFNQNMNSPQIEKALGPDLARMLPTPALYSQGTCIYCICSSIRTQQIKQIDYLHIHGEYNVIYWYADTFWLLFHCAIHKT